jgi:hypothetical protein
MIAQKKRGRPPLFGKAMTVAKRKKRCAAKKIAALRANPPAIVSALAALAMTSEEFAALYPNMQTLGEEEYEAWKAIPGAFDPADEDDD